MGTVRVMKQAVAILFCLAVAGCCPKVVPVSSERTNAIRYDSTLRITTSIVYVPVVVNIPSESRMNIVPQCDTSRLKAGPANSTAYIRPDGLLYHDLNVEQQDIERLVPVERTDSSLFVNRSKNTKERIEVPVPLQMNRWQKWMYVSGMVAWGVLLVLGVLRLRKLFALR